MPLRDHFRPPLSRQRLWHGFHNSWATYLSADVNRQLPEGWFAQANVQYAVEIDVAAFDEGAAFDEAASWSPGEPALLVPMTLLTDVVEVQVFAASGGPVLVGAVELVSPGNKDRPASREAFVTKCASMLQQGVGVAVVDAVTERRANLHAELLARVGPAGVRPLDADLYAAAYRPVRRGEEAFLAVWQEALTLGEPLPAVPLFLRGGPCVRLDLEGTYERTWREQGMPTNGAVAAT